MVDHLARTHLLARQHHDADERALPLRTTLGVQSAEDQLSAALLGREWLTRLADELDHP